ncbi:MAG: hypothetical protein RBG1_1C00001G0795 [candidate division Zixibacteria bacterium RBG-1]|nr:MAG: hypothetical protein RBG1_1C00001G0795 [candidate division Zixibacteria bacterium RBG-1]OGC83618.1 MAG: hypothetical protein A2V73_06610 [candidate division Zixibacteria bacterium RBG_19FT_COMBO_42_43]
MKISVKVKPNSKIEKVEKAEGFWLIYVKEPPQEDRANLAVINLLSEYFKVPKSRISILKGKKSRQKIVEIVNSTS